MNLFNSFPARVRAFTLMLALACAAFSTVLLGTVPMPADAAVSFSTTTRTARCTAIVTAAGASAKLKGYNGTRPANTGAVTGGNTLLASGAFGSTIGTCTSGALDWDEAGFTQTSSGFTAGTPTFFDITTSADVVVARVDVCGTAPCWTFTGTIATGQNLTLTTLGFTEGNL